MGVTAISAARFKLAYERPYIAHAVWALVPVEKPGLKTLAVDKFFRLYFDPVVEDLWTVDELTAVMYHEINHILRDHMFRGEHKDDPRIWNQAGDAEINDDIRDEGCWALPGQPVFPEGFGEKPHGMAEDYYEVLMKKKKQKGGKDGDQPGPWGPGGGDDCGSIAGGDSKDYEDPEPDENTAGLSEEEGELLKRQVAGEIKEAAKSRGDVPGHLENWAKEYTKEKVDWRKTLRTLLRNCISHASGASDFTFTKMSRRNQGDIVMPATFSPLPNIAVVIDTSGSMSDVMLGAAIAEVGGILKSHGAKEGVTVLAVDAKVHETKKVFKKEQINPKGRGGTDMRVGINAALALKPRPDIIVVITDGETPWPDKPPKTRVVVCLVPGYYGRQAPEWAKTVIVDKE